MMAWAKWYCFETQTRGENEKRVLSWALMIYKNILVETKIILVCFLCWQWEVFVATNHFDSNYKREGEKINNPSNRLENVAGVMGKILTLQVVIFATKYGVIQWGWTLAMNLLIAKGKNGTTDFIRFKP